MKVFFDGCVNDCFYIFGEFIGFFVKVRIRVRWKVGV